MGFGVWGLGFGVKGLGFSVSSLGSQAWKASSNWSFRSQPGACLRQLDRFTALKPESLQGLGFRVWSLGFRVPKPSALNPKPPTNLEERRDGTWHASEDVDEKANSSGFQGFRVQGLAFGGLGFWAFGRPKP